MEYQGSIDKMCLYVMFALRRQLQKAKGEKKNYTKDFIWEEANKVENPLYPIGEGLQPAVFQQLVEREDIEDSGETIRITTKGATDARYEPPKGVLP
jgi:hypothetical protein